jgi:hypothetical protein
MGLVKSWHPVGAETGQTHGPRPSPARNIAGRRIAPQPPSAGVALLRIAPEIVSVLDYSKGFGHSDLVTFSERDLDVRLRTTRHSWDDGTVSQ